MKAEELRNLSNKSQLEEVLDLCKKRASNKHDYLIQYRLTDDTISTLRNWGYVVLSYKNYQALQIISWDGRSANDPSLIKELESKLDDEYHYSPV